VQLVFKADSVCSVHRAAVRRHGL